MKTNQQMSPKIKNFLLVFILLVICLCAGTIGSSGIGLKPFVSEYKRGKVHANSRKLLEMEGVKDYDYAGPNPKHDISKGRKGGGKNP
ncbi:hypothetical protein CASFOL_004318 [Castilleja foliolosa]|uniref:Uncharacterized protein n=1 Tax=Castilleja foliolosa TaxID=1961234 RepID=A0ABD3EAX0_9LAMI